MHMSRYAQPNSIPSGTKNIGSRAFAGCAGLMEVEIPDSVTSIGEGVFDECPNVMLVCESDNYAAQYGRNNSIPYVIR